MTLAADLIADLDGVFLDQDDFAESAVYTPRDGSPRSLTVTVSDDTSRRADEAHHLTDVRTIRVLVKRDADEGIDNPQLRDRLVRDSEPLVSWDFQQIVEARPGHYVLQFTSTKLLHAGQLRPANL